MLPEEEVAQRPKAVTVIGWIWLVLAVLWLFRSLVNLVIWNVIRPVAPGLLGAVQARSPQTWFLRPLFEHFAAAMTLEAILSVAVGVSAWQLLRLAPWARVAVQTLCWIVLAFLTVFAMVWIVFWTKASGEPGTLPAIGFAAGLVICVALAAGPAVMIWLLRGSRVRDAFAHPRAGSEPAGR